MITNGVLLHVYHLGAKDWEGLVWGYPDEDAFGTVAQFAYTLLNIPVNEHVKSVVYSGPSTKDGLTEGAYTKQFLLDRIDELNNFPSLKQRIGSLSSDEYDIFLKRVHDLEPGPLVRNTYDEVTYAAKLFNTEDQVNTVFQIAAPSHAPRCLQNQLIARQNNLIPGRQPWYLVASDICFSGSDMNDVVILEPPHRGDDPMVDYSPTFARAVKPYFSMHARDKQRLIRVLQNEVVKE